MLPHIIEARYVSGHTVWLRFDDGAEGGVDLSKELHGPIFEPLRDPSSLILAGCRLTQLYGLPR